MSRLPCFSYHRSERADKRAELQMESSSLTHLLELRNNNNSSNMCVFSQKKIEKERERERERDEGKQKGAISC